MSTAAGAPALAVDVLLTDGSIAGIRSVQPTDEPALRELNARVSLRTRRFRFFSSSDRPGEWYVDRVLEEASLGCALVAEAGGQVVAVASFARVERDPQLADLGVLVDDAHQHLGLGALLLEHRGELARPQGITALAADVLVENAPMLGLLRSSGFVVTSTTSGAVVELRIELSETAELRDAVSRREVVAERSSLQPLLAPSSIAVVGDLGPRSTASDVWASLRSSGFRGQLRRVGPRDTLSAGVDLAVVAVPAADVLAVAENAAAAGVRALCVLSARFAETGAVGAVGAERQQALLAICRRAGMRLVGPDSLGVVSTDRESGFNATFCDARPRNGSAALVSQSSAVGITALRHAERRGAGLSAFVSTGDKADVSGNDLLAWFSDDPRTHVIALYLESFGNARRFARLAAAVGRTKPVVVLTSGRAHDAAADAMLRASGVLRADSLSSMFDVLTVLATDPLPSSRGHVAILGNSGGPQALAADACADAGLVLVRAVELLTTASPDDVEQALMAAAGDPRVDVLVAVGTPLHRGVQEQFAAAVARVHRAHPDVCLIATFPGVSAAPAGLPSTVAFFELPDHAVRALGTVVQHLRWRERRPAQLAPEVRERSAAIRSALPPLVDGDRWLSPPEAARLLERAGIPCDHATGAAELNGVELRVELTRDEAMGPLVTVGAGGRSSVWCDRVVRAATTDHEEALEQLAALRSARGFGPTTARPALDLAAAAHVVAAVGAVAVEVPEVLSLELDPLLVTVDGVVAVAARVRVGLPRPASRSAQRDLSLLQTPRS